MEALIILIAALLVDNLLLTKLFGVESFFGATQKTSGALLYGGLVTLVTVLAGTVALTFYNFVLEPLKIGYFKTFATVIVIALFICIVQFVITATYRKEDSAAECALPLISSNCVILASVLTCIESGLSFGMSLFFLLCSGLGFTLSMIVFSSIQKRLAVTEVPESFRGIPILLISCALVAMAFSGFFGISF